MVFRECVIEGHGYPRIVPLGRHCSNLVGGRDSLRLPLPNLLHLLHALQKELVLALLVPVPSVHAPPRQVEIVDAALVQRDEQLGAHVARAQRQARIHHLLLRRQVLPRRRHCWVRVLSPSPQPLRLRSQLLNALPARLWRLRCPLPRNNETLSIPISTAQYDTLGYPKYIRLIPTRYPFDTRTTL